MGVRIWLNGARIEWVITLHGPLAVLAYLVIQLVIWLWQQIGILVIAFIFLSLLR